MKGHRKLLKYSILRLNPGHGWEEIWEVLLEASKTFLLNVNFGIWFVSINVDVQYKLHFLRYERKT